MKSALSFLFVCLGSSLVIARSPLTTDPATVIGVGSCAKQGAPQPIWKSINACKPDVFLLIGDNIYADTTDMQVMKAKYALLGGQKEFRKLWRNTRLLATWDDHDFGLNDAGADYPMKRESQALFMDFFKVPKDSPMRSREGVYNATVFGPPGRRVQCILLDTRYFRSPLIAADGLVPPKKPYTANTDPNSTILGAAQWAWLEEQLREPAELRLICSSIQVVSQDHAAEKWMNFPHERERLYSLIARSGARGVVFLSGDRHLAELSMMEGGVGYPIYDLTSSGFNQAYTAGWRPAEINRHRVAVMNTGNNFGIVRIDWEAPDPEVRLEIRDEQGDVRICQRIRLSWLSPRKNK